MICGAGSLCVGKTKFKRANFDATKAISRSNGEKRVKVYESCGSVGSLYDNTISLQISVDPASASLIGSKLFTTLAFFYLCQQIPSY